MYPRRILRQNTTLAEEILWRYLRNNQLGFKFRRQFDIQSFIADFYCHSLKLVIELDGWTHDSEKTKQRDIIKQQVIERMGCRVIRFTNEQVYGDIEKILNKIIAVCKERIQELGIEK
ncbi:MAG: endonuclease domain-containing protein [Candidatus Magasanikbacteria bacterium]|nr:endonuclease domain-containing protein [Candidatus Magasanikbacteria bacterium]